jgi:hypothetical protein
VVIPRALDATGHDALGFEPSRDSEERKQPTERQKYEACAAPLAHQVEVLRPDLTMC